MKTKEFFKVLKENEEKELLFEYTKGQLVGANYHITEIKNTTVKSVDCGGRSDAWNETIIQLWESPKEIGKTTFMNCDKALSILEKVDGIYAIDKESQVLFEYSSSNFHKANLEIHNIELTSDKIIIKLFVSETDCKAKDACEVEEKETEHVGSCCSPNAGCC